MYAKGEGVARDDKAAIDWLLKAAQQGHAEARKEAAELLYTMGRYFEAAGLGHEGAARKLAEEMKQAGKPEAARELLVLFAYQAREAPPPPPAWPRGYSLDAGADPARTIAVRVAGVGSVQAVAVDPGMASPYEIIRWFPETDGKAKPK
jgi:TPR repeat protein